MVAPLFTIVCVLCVLGVLVRLNVCVLIEEQDFTKHRFEQQQDRRQRRFIHCGSTGGPSTACRDPACLLFLLICVAVLSAVGFVAVDAFLDRKKAGEKLKEWTKRTQGERMREDERE